MGDSRGRKWKKKKSNIAHDFGILPSWLSTVLKNKAFMTPSRRHSLQVRLHSTRKWCYPNMTNLTRPSRLGLWKHGWRMCHWAERLHSRRPWITCACLALMILKPARGGLATLKPDMPLLAMCCLVIRRTQMVKLHRHGCPMMPKASLKSTVHQNS